MFPFQGKKNGSKLKSELPEINRNIHGRSKEIDDIVKALTGKISTSIAGVLLTGTAGVGKTTVAIHAGHRLKDDFKAIVKFCSLRGAYQGDSEDDGVLIEILDVCVPGDQQGRKHHRYALRNWCRQLENELILIVDIDEAEDAIDDDEKLKNLLNLLSDMRKCSESKIKFLLTLRRSDIDTAEAVSDIQLFKIDLSRLNVRESIEILKASAKLTSNTEPETEVKLHEIAQLCDNIPLALRLVGPLLRKDSDYSFQELKQELEQNAANVFDAENIVKISFTKLDDSSKQALVYLSVFPQSFNRDAANAVLGDNCAKVLTNLRERCMIERQGDRYLIHLLIRSYAKLVGQREFDQILSEGKQRFLRHFLSLILENAKKYWGKDTCKESYTKFNEERINLESILRTIAGQKDLQKCSEWEAVMNECRQVAPYIKYCVHLKLYDELLESLLQFSRSQEKINKQVEILCLLHHEARKQSGQNNHKSEERILEAQKLHDDNPSDFDRDMLSEAFYLSHYGRYLSQDQHKIETAQPYFEKAISVYQVTAKHDCTFDKGRILIEAGNNAKLRERREEALKYYEEAIHFRSRNYGKHFLTAFAHKTLADYYLSIDDFSEAEKSYIEANQVLEDMEITGQKEVVPVYKNFGKCCEKRGKIDKARGLLEKGSDVAANTIEGYSIEKVKVNTYLALLLYQHYNEDSTAKEKADTLSKEVFKMSKELGMDEWRGKKELEELYYKK